MIHLRGFPCRLNKVIYRMPGAQWKIIKANSSAILSLLFFVHPLTHSFNKGWALRHVPALGWLLLVRSHPIPLHTPCCSVLCPRSLATMDGITQAPVPSGFQLETLAGNLRVGGGSKLDNLPCFALAPCLNMGVVGSSSSLSTALSFWGTQRHSSCPSVPRMTLSGPPPCLVGFLHPEHGLLVQFLQLISFESAAYWDLTD